MITPTMFFPFSKFEDLVKSLNTIEIEYFYIPKMKQSNFGYQV